MSVAKSNLSRYKDTNTDMTVSVTEEALNSQLLQYLASMSEADHQDNYTETAYIISWINDDGNPVSFLLDKNTDESKLPAGFPEDFYDSVQELTDQGTTLYQTLNDLDLFSIPSETKAEFSMNGSGKMPSGDAAKIQTASGYYVKYGILIEDGIPEGVFRRLRDGQGSHKISSLLKPVSLQPNKKNVLFKQFFRNICGVQLTTKVTGVYPEMKATCVLSKAEQTDDNIWYTPFDISLEFRAVDYVACGEEVTDKIRQMAEVTNPDDVFNISQLALDLQTLSATMSPTIKGFSHDVDNFMMSLIRSYFDRLEKAGQTVFGNVITVKPASNTKYLFTPKMRNYHISPRTLDYLIGFGDEKTIPNLGKDDNLQWDSDHDPLMAKNNGNNAAIAISAEHFLPFITEMIRPALSYLPCKIEVFADDPKFKSKFHVSSSYTPSSTSPDFTTKATPDNPVYTYTYSQSDQTKRHLMYNPFPVASLQLTHTYTANVTGAPRVYDFDGTGLPAFIFDFRITGWLLVDYNTNKSTKGTYFDQTVRMAVGIRIDSQTGNVDFVKKTITIDNHPSGISSNSWVKFMSAQHSQGYVGELVNHLIGMMSNIQNYSIEEFNRSVNSHIGFVMPGNKTFTFAYDHSNNTVNAITPSGDLYLYGNYVQEVAE